MDQEEDVKELTQPAPGWQSSMSGVRERNAVMLNKALLADVYFIVGSGPTRRRIAAHKCMVATGSSVFHAMFIGGLAEDNEITMPDVEPEAFLNLLKWVPHRINGSRRKIFMETNHSKMFLFTSCCQYG